MSTIAVLTADKEGPPALVRGDTHFGYATASSKFYRGAMAAYVGTTGRLVPIPLVASQTVDHTFAGIVMDNPYGPRENAQASGVAVDTMVPLLRHGCVAQRCWTPNITSGVVAATTTICTTQATLQTYIGRKVFALSDNDVCVVPPLTDYPICVGRIVAVPMSATAKIGDSAGYSTLDSTYAPGVHSKLEPSQVLIDISGVVGMASRDGWKYIPFYWTEKAAALILGDYSAGTPTGLTLSRYTYIRSVTIVPHTAVSAHSFIMSIGVDANEVALTDSNAAAVGVPVVSTVNMYSAPGSVLNVRISTGNATSPTGVGMGYIKCMDLD